MAVKANIVIDQGSDFSTSIYLQDDNGDPITVSGFSAAAQMRKTYTSLTATSFSTSLLDGELVLTLTNAQTANLVPGRYVYDVEITNASSVKSRIVEGMVTVTPEVTK